jgi:hypothetical protein
MSLFDRKLPPPLPVISGNGKLVACLFNTNLYIINSIDVSLAAVELPHEGRLTAISPHADLIGVAGYGQVSLFEGRSPFSLLATADTPAPLFRLAVGDGGLVAGVVDIDRQMSTLCVWRGEKLSPSFAGKGEPLGEAAPYGLQMDASRNRIVVWGLSGSGAFSGTGEWFVRLMSFAESGLKTIWRGADVPFVPEGCLLPLENGALGIYDRETLALLSISPNAEPQLRMSESGIFSDMETVVASPDGTHMAWFYTTWDGEQDHYHIRVVQVSDRSVVGEASPESLGWFPAMAVDDSGRVTIASSEHPDHIVVETLEAGQLIKKADVQMGSSTGA